MLDLEVRPGRSLSGAGFEFILGMPILEAIHLIRKCDRDIKKVELWYSDAVPLHMDIVICLQNDGVKLTFDPYMQRLRLIEVFDLQRVKLYYCGTVFSSGGGPAPTLSNIQMVFGATHPAEFDTKTQSYRLGFRGVQFDFAALDSGTPNAPVTQSRRARNADCPLQRVAVFTTALPAGAVSTFANDMTLAVLPPPIPAECFLGLCFAEKVELVRSVNPPVDGVQSLSNPLINGPSEFFVAPTRSDGLRFTILTDEPAPVRSVSGSAAEVPVSLLSDKVLDTADSLLNAIPNWNDAAPASAVDTEALSVAAGRRIVRTVRFGDTVQDVQAACGSPTRVFYKADDKMKIHAGDGWRRVVSGRSDYFYNYATLGVDLLFDAATHRVKKFVLHTNYPGHYDFGSYDRCPFAIPLYRYSNAHALNAVRADGDCIGNDQKQRRLSSHRADNSDLIGDRNDSPFAVQLDGDERKGSFSRHSSQSQSRAEAANEGESLDIAANDTGIYSESDLGGTDKSNDPHLSTLIVTPFTKWSQIVAFLGRPDLRPVELNRSSSQGASSPFGPTFCYGVQDLIFEVMPNDYIGSVTVYQRSANNCS